MPEKYCAECGAPLGNHVNHTKVYCSNRCTVRAWRRRKAAEAGTPIGPKTSDLKSQISELKQQMLEIITTLKEVFPDRIIVEYKDAK